TLQTCFGKRRHRLARHSHNRGRRRKQLETTDVPTLALQTTERIDSRVSNLAGRAMRTTPQLPVKNHSSTNTRAERDAHHTATAARSAHPHLSNYSGV